MRRMLAAAVISVLCLSTLLTVVNESHADVIGDDTRYRIDYTVAFPYRSIGALYVTRNYRLDDGSFLQGYAGTAFMIDEYHALSAAHCVLFPYPEGYVLSAEVILAKNGSQELYGRAKVTHIYTHEDFRFAGDNYDIAVLTLDRNIGQLTGWMPLYDDRYGPSAYSQTYTYVTGYPEYVNGEWVIGEMFSGYDTGLGFYEEIDGYGVHYYYTDTSGGDSGAPVWIEVPSLPNPERYVLSVHTYGGGTNNHGTLLTLRMRDWIGACCLMDPPPVDLPDLVFGIGYPPSTVNELYFKDSGFEPGAVYRNQTSFSVQAMVRNVGTAPSNSFTANFVCSNPSAIVDPGSGRPWGYILASVQVPSLYPTTGSYLVSWSFDKFPVYAYNLDDRYGYQKIITGSPTVNSVYITIDFNNTVAEFDETNNIQILPRLSNPHDFGFSVENVPPYADAGLDRVTNGGVPSTISFDGSGSYDIDGEIVSYTWDFGDGSEQESGMNPQHTYEEEGVYTVLLTVRDDEQYDYKEDQDDALVTVRQPIITAWAGSGGTINPSGSVSVNYGEDITFAVTPNANYHILSVWVDMVLVGAVTSYTFTNVDDDHSIAAYFVKDQFAISASAGIGGTISPSGSVLVNYGADQTFVMTADPGYEILDVIVDGTNHQGPIPIYIFPAVSSDHSITAFFGVNNHDIGVIDVTPTRTIVGSGYTVRIDVTVENQGARAESFNVTVYYGNSAITAEQWETFWSLGDVNRDGYINTIDMNIMGDAYGTTPGDPYWNLWADINQDLKVDIIDLSICSWNSGLEIWTYALSGGVIGAQTVIDLAAGSTQTLTFTWDTTGMPYGNYVIGAYAVPILGIGPPLGKEVDRADNTLTGGTVLVTIPGDVNGDHTVDVFDFLEIKYCRSGPPPGPGGYNPNFDVNSDGVIDVFDILIAKSHHGQSW